MRACERVIIQTDTICCGKY